jgi:hypothetical protein
MKRIPPAKGQLGFLAAPLVLAAMALALSACGVSAGNGSSASGSSPAPSATSAPGNRSAPSGSSAPVASPAQGDPAAFCETWRLVRPYFSQVFDLLTGRDPTYDMSTTADLLQPEISGLSSDMQTAADQEAPAAQSANMATVASYYAAIYADFRAEIGNNQNVTVGQVLADIRAHPPAQAAAVRPAVNDLSGYLAYACGVHLTT